jgi:hypothetical protein
LLIKIKTAATRRTTNATSSPIPERESFGAGAAFFEEAVLRLFPAEEALTVFFFLAEEADVFEADVLFPAVPFFFAVELVFFVAAIFLPI